MSEIKKLNSITDQDMQEGKKLTPYVFFHRFELAIQNPRHPLHGDCMRIYLDGCAAAEKAAKRKEASARKGQGK